MRAVAFLTDGRPVWSVVTTETEETPATSQLEVMSRKSEVTTALTVEGVVDRLAVDPGDPDGLYLRLYKSASPKAAIVPQPEHFAYVTLPHGGKAAVKGLLDRPTDLTKTVESRGPGTRIYVSQLSNPQPRPAFGVAKATIYFGEKGKLWRTRHDDRQTRRGAVFRRHRLRVLPASPPPVYSENLPASPTSILLRGSLTMAKA